ncbi:unnamed protein product [Rotaria socialis]|uniref:Uncharacterized protein n=1 Tax=Rotaria socialis TaxID=392032 RepID=A0A818RYG1_9BILA|nr:unnamed protein product [Rotaria socialis]CAF3568049.1 unnamed protein product [Rotaria socialis]CAF3657951.1 unnamed protein product [Rotaria socialis]CAF4467324.1 unnamed protein product [Rotaria socialis]CAF4703434.1 unnamed protein product [Rotaria socialis]
MGNSSSSTEEDEEDHIKRPIQPRRDGAKVVVRGSVYSGYQPPAQAVAELAKKRKTIIKHKSANYESTALQKKPPETSTPSDENNKLSSEDPSKQFTTTVEPMSPSSAQNSRAQLVLSPTMLQPNLNEVNAPSPNTFNDTAKPNSAPASSFEKGPVVCINYVVKPSDKNSRHIYELGNITVAHRMPTQSVASSGGRWYDNNYNKNA